MQVFLLRFTAFRTVSFQEAKYVGSFQLKTSSLGVRVQLLVLCGCELILFGLNLQNLNVVM